MKIKRYTLIVLILVTFVGFFSPMMVAHGVDPYNPAQTDPRDPNFVSTTTASPGSATAACGSLTGIGKIICQINQILNSIIPVLVALGVVYFVWGVVQYMIGGDEEAKKKGRSRIIYGIIGLAVIVSVWGLVNIIVTTFGLGGQSIATPTITVPEGSCNLGKNNNPKLQHLLVYVTCIISSAVIPLIFALAVAMFVWGVVQFVINSDEEAKKEKGKKFMLWGIIALTVMVSVWGLVRILGGTFGIEYAIPQVKVNK